VEVAAQEEGDEDDLEEVEEEDEEMEEVEERKFENKRKPKKEDDDGFTMT